MKNNHVKYFLTIEEERNISKAADKLFISQPSLSKYLIKLEESIGHKLFDRFPKGLELTEAGEAYLFYLNELQDLDKKLDSELLKLNDYTYGEVNLGITVWRSSVLLPQILPTFKKLYPNITINLFEGSHDYIGELLRNDIIDFAIAHSPNNIENTYFEDFFVENLLICINKNNPIVDSVLPKSDYSNKIPKLNIDDLHDLKDENVVLLKKDQHLRNLSDKLYQKLNFSPNILLETSNIMTAINVVNKGLGITFVPQTALLDNLPKDLLFFMIEGAQFQWEVGFIHKQNSYLSPQSKLLIRTIQNLNLLPN